MHGLREKSLVCLGVTAASGLLLGFFCYGGGRTLAETVGFDLRASFTGLFFVTFCALFVGSLTILAGLLFRIFPGLAFRVALAGCLVTGAGFLLVKPWEDVLL